MKQQERKPAGSEAKAKKQEKEKMRQFNKLKNYRPGSETEKMNDLPNWITEILL